MKSVATLWTIIRYLPAVYTLIGKIREALGDEKVQDAIGAFVKLVESVSPPAPSVDSAGENPHTPPAEKRKRLFRLKDRLKLASGITDKEVDEFACQRGYYRNNAMEA